MRSLPKGRGGLAGLAFGALAALAGCRDDPRAEATPREPAPVGTPIEAPAETPAEAPASTPTPARTAALPEAPARPPPTTGEDEGERQEPSARKLRIYFPNTRRADSSDDCAQVFPVERPWPETPGVAHAALEALLAGPTPEEQRAGFLTSLPEDARLASVRVAGGIATADFEELDLAGSCAVLSARAQIERTLEQFPTVRSVVVQVDGRSAEALQP